MTRIFEWCAYEGLTTYAIARRLTQMGVPTLSDVDRVNKRKRGAPGEWHKDTVHGMLTNATYKLIFRSLGEGFLVKSILPVERVVV